MNKKKIIFREILEKEIIIEDQGSEELNRAYADYLYKNEQVVLYPEDYRETTITIEDIEN